MRDPTSWFQSHYYFERFGWERKQETRSTGQKKSLTEEEKQMTIDECIESRHSACTKPSWKYTEFFCGTQEDCRTRSQNSLGNIHLRRALDKSKHNIMNFFYMIGI